MAEPTITVEQKNEPQSNTSGANPAAEINYIVTGTNDDIAAKNALITALPASRENNTMTLTEVTVEYLAPNQWLGKAKYGPYQRVVFPQKGQSTFSFDTSGGTQHITQGISTSGSYAPQDKTAPDFKGAIGVTKDNVEGVDITVPVYAFGVTCYLDDSVVTNNYKGTIFSLTGKTNNASFMGCNAGECLFLGASGSKRAKDDWEVTFRFAASPNRTGITVGDIGGISKKGWEYLWVLYDDQADANAKKIVKKPIAAYVEKVYEEGNFSALGIGT